MQRFLEKYLLPLAMILGFMFHKSLATINYLTPFLLASMLFITYCRVRWEDIHFNKFHLILLAIQYIGSAVIYIVLKPINLIVAQAAMICILAPTATSAPVVVGILGGNIASTATFSLFSNLTVAFVAPLYISWIGHDIVESGFYMSLTYIFKRVVPILLVPFVSSLLLQKMSSSLYKKVRSAQILSFYIWAVALTIVIGNVVHFVINQSNGNFILEIMLAFVAIIVCIVQFLGGRYIGSSFGCTITGGQSLGQKNTILAIWLTQTYLNPLASLGPGFYVIAQNMVNAYQIWKQKNRK